MTSAHSSSQNSRRHLHEIHLQKTHLHEQLQEHLFALDYAAFDALMHALLERSGYAPVLQSERKHKRGRTRSGGLDIRAYTRTDLASSLTLIQIKQYRRVVSRRFVDELRGTMLRLNAEQGLLLTTSTFSRVAWRAAALTEVAPIRLLDGKAIRGLMIEYRLGIEEDGRGRLRVDTTFFDNLQKRSRSTVETGRTKSSLSFSLPPSDPPPSLPNQPKTPRFKPTQVLPVNRADTGESGGDMQWRTHVLIGLNALWLLEALPGGVQREQLPLMLGAAAFGSLLPDLDAAQSKIKHLSAWGIKPFFLPSVAIYYAFGHRGFLHSTGALVLVAMASIPLSAYLGWPVGAALVLGYGAHLAADACTRSGIPFLYFPPFSRNKRRYHLLPPHLRFVTGSDAELALFPFISLLLLLLLLRHLAPGEVPPLATMHNTGKSFPADTSDF